MHIEIVYYSACANVYSSWYILFGDGSKDMWTTAEHSSDEEIIRGFCTDYIIQIEDSIEVRR